MPVGQLELTLMIQDLMYLGIALVLLVTAGWTLAEYVTVRRCRGCKRVRMLKINQAVSHTKCFRHI